MMESLNPFDDQQQRSLEAAQRTTTIQFVAGFPRHSVRLTIVFGPAARTACTEWLEQHWQDILPVAASKA